VQEVGEFRDMVTDLSRKFRMKVSGTPLWDPEIGSPFALAGEHDLVASSLGLERRASIVTGSIAAPFIEAILSQCGDGARVVPVEKEIACLITIEDLQSIETESLESLVIIPGRAFVYDREGEAVLSRDGVKRTVIRGPECLTTDAETSMGMERNAVLALEIEAFSELIQLVNRFGAPVELPRYH